MICLGVVLLAGVLHYHVPKESVTDFVQLAVIEAVQGIAFQNTAV